MLAFHDGKIGGETVRAPVRHAGDDQIIDLHDAGNKRKLLLDNIGDIAHADLVAAVPDAHRPDVVLVRDLEQDIRRRVVLADGNAAHIRVIVLRVQPAALHRNHAHGVILENHLPEKVDVHTDFCRSDLEITDPEKFRVLRLGDDHRTDSHIPQHAGQHRRSRRPVRLRIARHIKARRQQNDAALPRADFLRRLTAVIRLHVRTQLRHAALGVSQNNVLNMLHTFHLQK